MRFHRARSRSPLILVLFRGLYCPLLPGCDRTHGGKRREAETAWLRIAGRRRHRTGECAALLPLPADASPTRRGPVLVDAPIVSRTQADADTGGAPADAIGPRERERRASG